jgi:4-hydroxybenzoate polyprenyltransferase
MTTREPQTFSGASRLALYASLVKFPHTVFALPFALVGLTLASYVVAVDSRTVAWVVVAFTSARFVAMAFNRIADREFDARNPRTALREIPRGAVAVREAWFSVGVASAVFVLAAGMLNRLCLALSPLALAWVCFYSYTKRFTRWAHLALGVGMAIAPVGGYLALTGRWSHPWWVLVALASAVGSWVAGFDIFYSLQDVEFDRGQGLHSVPAALGEHRALLVARALHVATVLLLTVVGWATGGGWLWFAGVALAAALLLYEHSLVRADDLSKLDAAFFTTNGIISVAFFAFVLAERILRR